MKQKCFFFYWPIRTSIHLESCKGFLHKSDSFVNDGFVETITLFAVLPLIARFAKASITVIVTRTGGAILTRVACFAWICNSL